MLSVDVKINGEPVAAISARKIRLIEENMGDFVGERHGIYEYACAVKTFDESGGKVFKLHHDRRFGWQGLVWQILNEVSEPIVCTVSKIDLTPSQQQTAGEP